MARPVQRFDFAIDYTDGGAERQTGSLAGLAVTLLLVVVGLYLINTLRAQSDLQDCIMSGHAACSGVDSEAADIAAPA